ncbi:M20 metallopeptidase family protein [Cupriavidus sp. EM10]|uniref:M20 metallopeptidase family protein n=2 Tax=unclassified Cupriavidus TaxID=2640874 RepID=UPI00351D176F
MVKEMVMLTQAFAIQDELVSLRRNIHRCPELGFQELRTAGVVTRYLLETGVNRVSTGVGGTGVVAYIGALEGPTIAIRADMDALPITEKTALSFASENPGVMHACGHDAHTAMLLGVAKLLQRDFLDNRHAWKGNVRLLFQPSEEGFDGNGLSGATAMIADGALAGVDAVIALHVDSNHPSGICYFQDGASLASVDSFNAWIFAEGGHGAYPHLGRDPLFMLGPILNTIYAIPSRRISPLDSCILSLGQIQAGKAPNVIPDSVYLSGTVRAFDEQVRTQLWNELEAALRLSEAMGGGYRLEKLHGYPVMFNDQQINKWLRRTVLDLMGEETIDTTEFGMGAEDFSYMTQSSKGAMFMLGAALPDGVVRNHHSDTFDIDESVMPLGTAVLAETARRFVTREYAVLPDMPVS